MPERVEFGVETVSWEYMAGNTPEIGSSVPKNWTYLISRLAASSSDSFPAIRTSAFALPLAKAGVKPWVYKSAPSYMGRHQHPLFELKKEI